MLTIEMLRQNSALAGLSDAQLTAIAEMSKNDENTVIGTKIGALHGQYDTDIFNVTGIKKKDGEKSYDYAKRVLGEYKTKAESVKTVQAELDAANAKVTELQTSCTATCLFATCINYKTKEAEFNKQLKDVHVDYAFQAATTGLKFKAGITEPIQKTLLNAAKAEILAKGTPDFVEDGQGGKKLVIRGADGNILNNPKNNLNPYTISELVMETSLKDVIDAGRKQTGGGTGGFQGRGGQGGTLDLTGVRTQLEADKVIEAHLLANGLTRDSSEFGEKLTEIRNENNVATLPIR